MTRGFKEVKSEKETNDNNRPFDSSCPLRQAMPTEVQDNQAISDKSNEGIRRHNRKATDNGDVLEQVGR